MGDREALSRLADRDPDPAIRAAAAERLLFKEGFSSEAGREQLLQILKDPAVRSYYGELQLGYDSRLEEKRYVKQGRDLAYPPPRGKVLVEQVKVSITDGRGNQVAAREYRGKKGRKGEAFESPSAIADGCFIQYNGAEIDFLEIARDLLKPFDTQRLGEASRSRNKYVAYAAGTYLHP
jgi:hypothetical protein